MARLAVIAILLWQQVPIAQTVGPDRGDGPNRPAGAMRPPAFGGRGLAPAAARADTKKLYTFQAFESGVSEGSESLKSFVVRRRAFLLQEK